MARKGTITEEMISKVHSILANLNTGEEILKFLRTTEPVFMKEVARYVHNEMNRFDDGKNRNQTMYLGSVIGAAYIAGLLIAREASHQMLDISENKILDTKDKNEDSKKNFNMKQIDALIDKYLEQGKTPKEIDKEIKKQITGKTKKKKSLKKPTKRERLDLNDFKL